MNDLFRGLFDNDIVKVISVEQFLLCMCAALVAGLVIAWTYSYKNKYSKGFMATLITLPVVVCVVIMIVNGNVGTGVAVAGAFSLVRFRSTPGTAKEICAIFMTMAAGLLAGMGYLGYSVLFAVLVGVLSMVLTVVFLSDSESAKRDKQLRITIPEGLNYTEVFEEILLKFAENYELVQVKTTNLGSMFRLTYNLRMKKNSSEKEMIDELRVKNGNLEISVSRPETVAISEF